MASNGGAGVSPPVRSAPHAMGRDTSGPYTSPFFVPPLVAEPLI
ncbi:MAG: hypothetical protein ACJ788_26160 [Ktedonobacteraceae bacterium]